MENAKANKSTKQIENIKDNNKNSQLSDVKKRCYKHNCNNEVHDGNTVCYYHLGLRWDNVF